MPEGRRERGLIDTSVVIELPTIDAADLPEQVAVSAISLAELAAGPHATRDPAERARRQDRLQRVEATFEPLPFDAEAARAYGRVYAAVMGAGRKARGQRAVDLLIAATALAAGLPLYTRNPADFAGLAGLVEIVSAGNPWVRRESMCGGVGITAGAASDRAVPGVPRRPTSTTTT